MHFASGSTGNLEGAVGLHLIVTWAFKDYESYIMSNWSASELVSPEVWACLSKHCSICFRKYPITQPRNANFRQCTRAAEL